MKILKYFYSDDIVDGWEINEIKLRNLNLFVGISGSGKTKTLNTIYNLALYIIHGQIASNGQIVINGQTINNQQLINKAHWNIEFKITNCDDIFHWEIIIKDFNVVFETLKKNNNQNIIDRNIDKFVYNGINLPLLDKTQSALKLLSNDGIIETISKDFLKILRRNFFDAELEYQSGIAGFDENMMLSDMNFNISNGLSIKNSILPMVVRLSILEKTNYLIWEEIKSTFLMFFKNFTDMYFDKIDNNHMQIFFKEGDDSIILNDLSTGEKKALLIISDVLSMKESSIYIIDEIENSLGTNILDELVEFLLEKVQNIQFIITSHHPYIINNIPYDNWRLVKRVNRNIRIINGDELSPEFKLSKHEAFIKLQNMDL